MMGDTTAPTLSTTLLSTTLKRGPGGDAVEYGTVDLATQLIKVTVLFWFISTDPPRDWNETGTRRSANV